MEIEIYTLYSHVQLAKKCQGKLYSVTKDSYFILQKKSLLFLDCTSSRTAFFKDTIITTIQVKVKIFSKINRYLIKVNLNAYIFALTFLKLQREKFRFGEIVEHNNKERH